LKNISSRSGVILTGAYSVARRAGWNNFFNSGVFQPAFLFVPIVLLVSIDLFVPILARRALGLSSRQRLMVQYAPQFLRAAKASVFYSNANFFQIFRVFKGV
jgi:hypothetical protein